MTEHNAYDYDFSSDELTHDEKVFLKDLNSLQEDVAARREVREYSGFRNETDADREFRHILQDAQDKLNKQLVKQFTEIYKFRRTNISRQEKEMEELKEHFIVLKKKVESQGKNIVRLTAQNNERRFV